MIRRLLYLLSAVWLVPALAAFSFDTQPSLSLTNSRGEYILSWPLAATNWVLDRAADLAAGSWFRVPTTLYQSNGPSRYVRVSALESSAFYRLRQLGPPLPGVAGRWALDEGTGQFAEDESGGKTALFFTNTAWAAGRIGPAALWFNGAGGDEGSRAWVTNAAPRLLPGSGQAWSVSLWFSPDLLTTGSRTLAGSNDGGTNGWEVVLDTDGPGTNSLVFRGVGAPLSLSITGRTLLLPGQWHELTVTHSGSKGAIYLDTRMLAEGLGALSMPDGPIYFGGGTHDSFFGRLDDIRVYTNCLTREQISLAGHWCFDENAGVFTADKSIKGHHAMLMNTGGWVPGHDGPGVQLNSSQVLIRNDDYTVLPGSGGSFSVSFWLRPDALVDGRSGLIRCGSGTIGGWQLALNVSGAMTTLLFTSTNCGGTLDLSVPLPLTNGVWTKIDATHNGGIATLYANGRKLQARNGAIHGSRGPILIGAAAGLSGFDGTMDDLKIFSCERHPAEIGPVAGTMWETAFINKTTNIVLRGDGPAGKLLTYSILPIPGPTNGTISPVAGSAIVAYAAGPRKGPDAFAYTVSDGEFTSEPAIVALSVVKPHWLSPLTGSAERRDGRSPGRAWPTGAASALDAIWKTNNYYDCFFYAPGEYQTTGFKYLERSTANPGCKHIGSGFAGVNRTVVRLVDTWGPATEGYIFAPLFKGLACDGFEVQHMILDCNAANNPKYAVGEPVRIRIPLRANSWVESISLGWRRGNVPRSGSAEPLRFGPAAEFSVCDRESSVTNCTSLSSTGAVDIVAVGAHADELLVQLTRRAADVDFYSLAEIGVSGGQVSLPSATIPGGGRSQFDDEQSILAAVDGDLGTTWMSGEEPEVRIVLPLAPGTQLTQINLYWNCVTIEGVGRFGPAAGYAIRARDESTGQDHDVAFTRHGRTADGVEPNTFGTAQATNVVVTDQLTIVLTNRASLVNYYSLREVTLQNGSQPANLRVPSASSTGNWAGNGGILRAFDENPSTLWTSGSQGMVGGINVMGSNLKFSHLKMIGFGTKAGTECFPMYLSSQGQSATPLRFGNVIIEDCSFTEPATNNTEGLTVVSLTAYPPDTLTNAIVRRCTVAALRPHFGTSQAFSAVHVENCIVEDCSLGVYFEPFPPHGDDLGPVLVRSNRFVNVDSGVFILDHPGGQFDSLTCLDNEIVLAGHKGWGIAACDVCAIGPSGSITNVTALNNIIRYADWQPRPDREEGGFLYSDIHHAVVGNNIIVLGTARDMRVRHCPAGTIVPPPPTEDCDGRVTVPPGGITYPPCLDPPPPGYRRAWFNNRKLSGPLLDVLLWNRGVDGPSSQQQWPE
jgi:hypothetical protein